MAYSWDAAAAGGGGGDSGLRGEVFYDYQRIDGPYGEYFTQLESQVPLSWRETLGDDFFHAVAYVRIPSTSTEKGQLKRPSIDQIVHLSKLVHVSLDDWPVDDDDLKQIGRLKRLRHLVIGNGIEVTDAGVAHLGGLRDLRDLYLRNSQITDASLEVFSRMSELVELDLLFHRFSDKGVTHLRRLKKLENLSLSGLEDQPSEITDESLMFLLDLPQFYELNVRHSQVTEDFAKKLNERFFPHGYVFR